MIRKNAVEKLRDKMADSKVDASLVTSGENVFYLSGFTGYGDASLLITFDQCHIITDGRYTLQVAEECPEFNPIISHSLDMGRINDLLSGCSRMFFEDGTIRYSAHANVAKGLPSLELVPLGDFLETLRNIKEVDELQFIARACEISCEAFIQTLPYVKAGVSEIDIACELEYRMKKLGGERTSFDTIVASGYRSAMPHGTASEKLLEKGDCVVFDFGTVYKGYCSDMTRTVFIDHVPGKMGEIYQIVRQAQQNTLDRFKEGMTGGDLDSIARGIIDAFGYGQYFNHGLGHGVGIKVHEPVRIGKGGQQTLTDGMVFSIEPGIYIEGQGGVRIEDLVTIQNGKLVNLTEIVNKDIYCLT